jgi:hypothetical protein
MENVAAQQVLIKKLPNTIVLYEKIIDDWSQYVKFQSITNSTVFVHRKSLKLMPKPVATASQPASQQNNPAGIHITTWQGRRPKTGINIHFVLPSGPIPMNILMGTGI